MITLDPTAGTTLVHPVVVTSLTVLVLNDHVLKRMYPGWITGKLSDFAGLVLFPVVVVSAIELFANRPRGSLRGLFTSIIVITGLVFTAVQTTEIGDRLYRLVWGGLWALYPWSSSSGPAALTQDPTDLIALPMLAASLWVYRRRREDPPRG